MNGDQQQALIDLGRYLLKAKYRFTTVTPESHKRALSRSNFISEQIKDLERNELKREVRDLSALRLLLGWSVEVEKDKVPEVVRDFLAKASFLTERGKYVSSGVRFSTLHEMIFVHSKYPTTTENAVFFGPDSYRFTRFLCREIKKANRIIDLGCGTGVGGISLSRNLLNQRKQPTSKLYLSDINEAALEFSSINVKINAVDSLVDSVEIIKSDLLKSVPQGADLIIANPPFIMDSSSRAYRHGGDTYGIDLSVRIVESSLNYLHAGGQLALYTGSCVVKGQDMFLKSIQPLISSNQKLSFTYEELDPDIFGEELSEPQYEDVDRIAAVGLLVEIKNA